jgi:RNA polymerase sigma factor (sigma-70 family)
MQLEDGAPVEYGLASPMACGDQQPGSRGSADARFASTHWSVVLGAGRPLPSDAEEALTRLCRDYWYPLYAYLRRRGYAAEEAQDLTQEFFARFLQKDYVCQADRQRGRFRTFLLSSLNHYLTNEWDKRNTVKRGGRYLFVSWEELGAEDHYAREPCHDLTPEKLYDRRWALALIDRTFKALRREYEVSGDLAMFDALEAQLVDHAETGPWAQVAVQLGLSEGAVKMRIHRLRRRFGEMLRAEVAETVGSPRELEEEMRYLFAVWD